MKKLVLALALAALASGAAAQERRPVVGLGIGIVPVDSIETLLPAEVYVPIGVAPNFRLEPSLGVFTNDQRAGGTDSSRVTVGLGAFFVTRVAEPTDMYLGGRLKIGFVSADNGLAQDDENDWSIAAAAGGEHYLGARFSLGLEGQLGHYQNGRLTGVLDGNDSGFFTSGVLFARAYFR